MDVVTAALFINHDAESLNMSRDSVYRENYPNFLREVFEQHPEYIGDYKQIASIFGVSRATIFNWRAKYPEFANAVNDVRDLGADRAEEGMYQLAEGSVSTKTIEKPDGQIITETTRAAPDFRALKFILTNRRPNDWKDKADIALSGEGLTPLIVFADDLTPEAKRNLEMKNNGKVVYQFDEQDAGLL